MTLDLSKNFVGIDGQLPKNEKGEPVETSYAKIVAQALFSATKGDALKLHSLALTLYGAGKLELDKADAKTLRDFVSNHEGLTVAVKAPVLEEIDKLK